MLVRMVESPLVGNGLERLKDEVVFGRWDYVAFRGFPLFKANCARNSQAPQSVLRAVVERRIENSIGVKGAYMVDSPEKKKGDRSRPVGCLLQVVAKVRRDQCTS